MTRSSVVARLIDHLPEYLIEASGLGLFMVSAALCTTALEYPGSWLHAAIPDGTVRRAIVGLGMGLTAMGLIYSPWGRRSGAHLNPSVTLAFLRLKKIRVLDAWGYIVAQFLGALLGVVLAQQLLGSAFTSPPVSWVMTRPGAAGALAAFAAEVALSAGLMATVLGFSASRRLAPYTGVAAGMLILTYIVVEAPVSGMSMNPARSVASAAAARQWHDLWVYILAPVLGMQAAVQWHRWRAQPIACAKLIHLSRDRCIHCGHQPGTAPAPKARP